MFISGHDFFAKAGTAAVCTVHGDVWLIEGIDDDLDRIVWRRFATGLFQPLGLKIVDDHVLVLGRDQITRLHDRNGDGEADYYESFNHDAKTSAGGHDYSACLETDSKGNLYYVSHRGVHRISADGGKYDTVAAGLRNPNGMAIGPGDVITAAPQEGEWTPASAVFEVTDGGYYGFGGPRSTPHRPMGFDPPLFWIPRRIDNSTGGQVWTPRRRWGPLAGQLLTLSFGQCRVLLCPLEPRQCELPAAWPIAGDDREVRVPEASRVIPESAKFLQGGSFAMPWSFDSGIMRGRFSPHDGQLYLTGLRGWVSAVAKDGCFQRVRYTGLPAYVPTQVRTLKNGIALTFSTPLDLSIAEDPDSFDVKRWNYRYGGQYGSDEYHSTNPDIVGREEVAVRSATRIDEKSVFLQMDDVQPVMQMSISYALRSADGHSMRDTYYHTINYVPSIRMDATRLTPRPRQNQRVARPEELRPGLRWEFEAVPTVGHDSQSDGMAVATDARVSRMAALYVPAGHAPTPFLDAGSFRARPKVFCMWICVTRSRCPSKDAGRSVCGSTVTICSWRKAITWVVACDVQ